MHMFTTFMLTHAIVYCVVQILSRKSDKLILTGDQFIKTFVTNLLS